MQTANIQYFNNGNFDGSFANNSSWGLMQGEGDPEATARTYDLMEIF
jgi:hypothetical protein